jgi:hypothetical protein
MTVRELKEYLADKPDEMKVYYARCYECEIDYPTASINMEEMMEDGIPTGETALVVDWE